MDLDALSALEAGKKSGGRSSQFNPRLKPRARPVRQVRLCCMQVCMRRMRRISRESGAC